MEPSYKTVCSLFQGFFLQPNFVSNFVLNFVLNFGENEDWEKKNGNLSKRKKKQA